MNVNKKSKTTNAFLSGKEEHTVNACGAAAAENTVVEGREKLNENSRMIETELDIKHNAEQSEYWQEFMVKGVEKSLHKIITNITFFANKRNELKVVHEAKVKANTFFDTELTSSVSRLSRSETILLQIQEEKHFRNVQLLNGDI